MLHKNVPRFPQSGHPQHSFVSIGPLHPGNHTVVHCAPRIEQPASSTTSGFVHVQQPQYQSTHSNQNQLPPTFPRTQGLPHAPYGQPPGQQYTSNVGVYGHQGQIQLTNVVNRTSDQEYSNRSYIGQAVQAGTQAYPISRSVQIAGPRYPPGQGVDVSVPANGYSGWVANSVSNPAQIRQVVVPVPGGNRIAGDHVAEPGMR